MGEEKEINLYVAIACMKELTAQGKTFAFKFRKYDRSRLKGGELVEIKAAKLRPKASEETVVNSSYKLYFYDTDREEPRVCWQPLIVEFNGLKTILN